MRSTTPCRPARSAVEPLTPHPAADPQLLTLARQPWVVRVHAIPLLVRPSTEHDLPAVARMHTRCSPRSLLDRYRAGGRPPAVAAIDRLLRRADTVVVTTADGGVVAVSTLARDPDHNHFCAEVGLLVEDSWQRLGIGTELLGHMAGVASALGYHELIAYPATSTAVAQRLLVELGRTRLVPDPETHLHTHLPEGAALGLGSVRRRLAG